MNIVLKDVDFEHVKLLQAYKKLETCKLILLNQVDLLKHYPSLAKEKARKCICELLEARTSLVSLIDFDSVNELIGEAYALTEKKEVEE